MDIYMKRLTGRVRARRTVGALLTGLVTLAAMATSDMAQAARLPSSPTLPLFLASASTGSLAQSASACPAEEPVQIDANIADPRTVLRPSQDPFYTAPTGYAACANGYVLRSRKINAMWGLNALSATFLTSIANFLDGFPGLGHVFSEWPIIADVTKNLQLDSYQLLFKSTDSHDRPIVAVTTVVVPQAGIWRIYAGKMHLTSNGDKEWNAPTDARPLISYEADQDSSNFDEAPSYSARVGWANLLLDASFWVKPPPEASLQSIEALLERLGLPGFFWYGPELALQTKGKIPKISASAFEILLGLPALLEGYAVAFPDHEGPEGAFINGKQSGQIVLDGIRAATRYRHYVDGTKIDPSSKVALWAYSGGGSPALWAVELANSYAPELAKNNLVGAAIGAGAGPDLGAMVSYNERKVSVGLVPLAINGLIRAFPEAGISENVLSEKGRAYINEAGKYGTLDGVAELLVKWLDDTNGDQGLEYYTKDPSRSVNDWPEVIKVVRGNSVNFQPSQLGRPRMPTLIYHDQNDGAVPVSAEDTMIRKYCKEGSPVQVMRFDTPLADFGTYISKVMGLAQLIPDPLDFLGIKKRARAWQLISRDVPGVLIHIFGEVWGDLPALHYIAGRFNGQTPRNDCAQIPSATADNNPPGHWAWKGLSLWNPVPHWEWEGANAPWEPQPDRGLLGLDHQVKRDAYQAARTD